MHGHIAFGNENPCTVDGSVQKYNVKYDIIKAELLIAVEQEVTYVNNLPPMLTSKP